MWEPKSWIYLSLGCTTFLGCAYLRLCPAVVWEMEGADVLSASLSMVGQAPGSCSSWLCPHMCLTQACSSPALMGWECVCGGPYVLAPHEELMGVQ